MVFLFTLMRGERQRSFAGKRKNDTFRFGQTFISYRFSGYAKSESGNLESKWARAAIKYLVEDGRYDYIETGSLMSIRKNVRGKLQCCVLGSVRSGYGSAREMDRRFLQPDTRSRE